MNNVFRRPSRGAKKSSTRLLTGITLFSASLSASMATAQGQLEEVIVTAQKRAQSLQEVGISISAFGEDDVKSRGLDNLDRLAAAVPNLQALDEAAGLPSFRIRGIGLNEFQAAFDSPVGVHLDEIFLSKPMLASMGFFDVARIEVLKGPQGTLFGRNTTGGSVNYYSNTPAPEFEAGISAGYGKYSRLDTDAYISGPLSENVSGRLAARVKSYSADGPYRNLHNDRKLGKLDQEQLRAQLLWSGELTSVLLSAEYGSKEGELTPYDNLFQTEPGGLPDVDREIRDPVSRFTVNQDYFPTTDSDTWGLTLRVEHELAAGTLTWLSGVKDFTRDNREDSDNTPIISTNIDWYSSVNQFTQEVRFSGETDRWNYLLGAYYERDKLETVETLAVSDLWELGITDFAQLGADHKVKTDSYAAFFSSDFSISEVTTLILGMRYTQETNRIVGDSFLTLSPVPTIGKRDAIAQADRVVLVPADSKRTDDDINFKLGLNFQLSDAALVYGSASTGFRSGGYDLASGSPSLETFEPEEVTAFEAGIKTTLLNNTMTVNTAGFYTTIENYQSNVNFADELLPRRRNVGTLDTWGAEMDIRWQPHKHWLFQLAGGYTHAEITKVARDADGNDLVVDGVPIKGNTPENTPEWSFSGVAEYIQPITDTKNLELLAAVNWNDERYLELENGPDHLVSSYYTLDASVSLSSQNGKWRASLWGRNLTDEDYLRYINDVPGFGLFLTINSEPRTYGASLDYHF
ncbi:MAG: TonB-dependent receptor [Haliea sp.]